MVPPCSDRISRVPPYSRIQQPGRIRGYHPLWPDFPDRSAYNCRTTGLFRVRSPLLAESLLMSFPPGTEMFQFPGFASPAYGFSWRYPSRGGLPHSDIHGSKPARGSPWLFAACHVLHRLLVPRHPPNALLALEIEARYDWHRIGFPPCPGPIHTPTPSSRRTPGADGPAARQASLSTHTTPLNPRARTAWAELSLQPGQTTTTRHGPIAPALTHHGNGHTRPETHQNLIHPDKDHRCPGQGRTTPDDIVPASPLRG